MTSQAGCGDSFGVSAGVVCIKTLYVQGHEQLNHLVNLLRGQGVDRRFDPPMDVDLALRTDEPIGLLNLAQRP